VAANSQYHPQQQQHAAVGLCIEKYHLPFTTKLAHIERHSTYDGDLFLIASSWLKTGFTPGHPIHVKILSCSVSVAGSSLLWWESKLVVFSYISKHWKEWRKMKEWRNEGMKENEGKWRKMKEWRTILLVGLVLWRNEGILQSSLFVPGKQYFRLWKGVSTIRDIIRSSVKGMTSLIVSCHTPSTLFMEHGKGERGIFLIFIELLPVLTTTKFSPYESYFSIEYNMLSLVYILHAIIKVSHYQLKDPLPFFQIS
jgi:hypothetical protein